MQARSGFSSFPSAKPRPDDLDPVSASAVRARKPSQASALNGSQAPSVTSKASSSSMYESALSLLPAKNPASGQQRLRSQYPAENKNNHVEFILVAAFDIDRGSIMEHQYPGPISGDETMLAELMLPDQVHSRSQDWTVFFLHKDQGDDDLDSPHSDGPNQKNNGSTNTASSDGEESLNSTEEYDEADDAFESAPVIYVLNHVNTKHDKTVERGAVVKAMAICTRHSFVDIFKVGPKSNEHANIVQDSHADVVKPVLVLAIEEYFKAPTWDTLAMLFDSVNAMDLSLMPKLSLLERYILQASNAKDLFVEKFERMIQQERDLEGSAVPDDNFGSGENTPQTAGMRHAVPRDTHEFETRIRFNNHSVPVKIPTAKSAETVGSFSVIKLIQTFSAPHQATPQPFTIHPHLTTGGALTHPIIVLINALLTQKRVIFLGHNRPSEEVAEAVLAACSLVSGGVLRGFTRHAFPYTDLTKVDDLQRIPGFIAGVTNPIFAATPKWWDLLCDLPSGRMKISNLMEQPVVTDGWQAFLQQNPQLMSTINSSAGAAQDYTGDVAFMENVQKTITKRQGEGAIRQMWRDWIIKLTRIAATFEEIIYGTSALYIGGDQADAGDFGLSGHGYVWSDEASKQRELAGNLSRIEGWRQTRSYYSFKQDLVHMYNSMPIKTLDLHYHHDRLRTQKLSHNDSAAIFLGLSAAVRTPQEICQLLVITSETHGGLFYLSLGLLHPQKEVRYKTVELLERIKGHEAGKHFWDSMGRFAKLAFFRIAREMEAASGAWDAQLDRVISGNTQQRSAAAI